MAAWFGSTLRAAPNTRIACRPWSGLSPKLPTTTATLDGELCLIDPSGGAHFYRLMHQMRRRGQTKGLLMFVVFDLLHEDGIDLRGLPLCKRERDLARFADGRTRLSANRSRRPRW